MASHRQAHRAHREPHRQHRSIERSGAQGTPAPAGHAPYFGGPFSFMRHFGEQMDRMFYELFGGLATRLVEDTSWPQLEVTHRDNKLVIHADVPGLRKNDVNVELRDHELVISGERHSESEQEEGGYYLSERSYGSFHRAIPLPEWAKPETASATFDHGVLRIEIEAPNAQETRDKGRRIEVREGSAH